MGQHSEAELNRKFIETAKLMNIYLNHFPKFEKYALAQQIRQCMYEVYAYIVVSILGHARRTHSLKNLIAAIKEKNHALYCQLPKAYRQPAHC